MSQKKQYSYNGPVLEFGRCVADHYKASTYATSEAKARSNIAYRYKQETGKIARTQIKLPGKLVVIE